MVRRREDFPTPDGPVIANRSPAGILKLRSLMTARRPRDTSRLEISIERDIKITNN
jgi:hypothetical protein